MQIVSTLRCNFECLHCCYRCSPKTGEHMHYYVLQNILKNEGNQDFINYCGGEIFCDPQWREKLELVLSYGPCILRIVTNGSFFYNKKGQKTKTLNEFLEVLNGYPETQINICISDDIYHEQEYQRLNLFPLEKVIRNFQRDIDEEEEYYLPHVTFEKDRRDQKTNAYMPLGRAKDNMLYDNSGICSIETDYFEHNYFPNGDISICCNIQYKIGTYEDDLEKIDERYRKFFKQQDSCGSCKYLERLEA